MENKDSRVYFIFGVHNHQPVGNLSYVFDAAFQKCYLPFISILENFPHLKAVIHNSGALYEWAESRFPEWVDTLKLLIKRGQIELTGGGYFEPIFPIIIEKDRINQIQLMSRYLKNVFGVHPKGCWIPERVWEPSLAKTLNHCGLQYAYLDEANFSSGKNNKDISLYLTEEQGYPLILFAIDGLLAGKIPFISPEEAIDILLGYKADKDILVTFFCDGEKFGFWPGTYELVYQQGWLERFFILLEKNPQIETILPAEAAKRFPCRKLTYIRTSSYPRMEAWAGGNFKNFFIKYSRLNFMHKRMLEIAKKLNSSLNWEKDQEAFLNLWRAQANCVYWHGLFGGFYLPHLRKACYDYLLKAEAYLDKKKGSEKIRQEDIDFDGNKEIVLKICDKNYVFSRLGASLDELSLKNIPLNLINTINRVKEPYHSRFKNQQLSQYLIYDNYKKTALIDHFLKKGLSLDEFRRGEGVFSLAGKLYEFLKNTGSNQKLDFLYRGEACFKKEIEVYDKGLKASYCFDEKKPLNNLGFGIECNLSLSGPDKLSFQGLDTKGRDFCQAQDLGLIDSFAVFDKGYGLTVGFKFNQSRVFVNPVYTLSSSESGEDVLFQQLSVLFILDTGIQNFSLWLNTDR